MADERLYLGPGVRSGSHWVYREAGVLTVEWYDHGDAAPYESSNTITFDAEQEQALLAALELRIQPGGDEAMLALQARFSNYFSVQRFAERHSVGHTEGVNFWP
jgi:hypothetical protein